MVPAHARVFWGASAEDGTQHVSGDPMARSDLPQAGHDITCSKISRMLGSSVKLLYCYVRVSRINHQCIAGAWLRSLGHSLHPLQHCHAACRPRAFPDCQARQTLRSATIRSILKVLLYKLSVSFISPVLATVTITWPGAVAKPRHILSLRRCLFRSCNLSSRKLISRRVDSC
jgi:hypothetical protein